MKKILSILLLLMILLSACSTKTEETTKAEKELGDEIEGEVDQGEEKEKLKTFDEVYSSELIKALDYFNDNLDKFTEDEKKVFAKKIIDAYNNILIDESIGDYPIPEMAFQPMYPILDDDLYDFYNFTTNEFNLTYFETYQTHAREFYKKMSNHDILTIGINIWADSGYLEPNTFVPIVKPDVYEKFKSVIETMGNGFELPNYLPNMEYNGVDSVINSNITYPHVLMHNFDEMLELEDKETWKTELILPVKFMEKKKRK